MARAVWISSAPRTGSMWLFNVARQLVQESNYNLKPLIVPQHDNEAVELFNASLDNSDDLDFLVLKIHTFLLKPNMPNSKIITTHRDPRDLIVSFMEFMNVEFERAFKAAKTLIAYTDTYKSFDKNYLTMIPFRDIENQPKTVVSKLADFLNIDAGEAITSSIVDRLAKKNVKKIINETDRKLGEKLAGDAEIDAREIVRLSDTNYRSFNLETGFQTGHISNRNTGDWVNVLTDDQISRINEFFSEWMDEFGYER